MRRVLWGALIGAVAGLACVGVLLHTMRGTGDLEWFLSFPFGLVAAYGLGSLSCCGSGPVWHVIVFAVVALNFMVIGAIIGPLIKFFSE